MTANARVPYLKRLVMTHSLIWRNPMPRAWRDYPVIMRVLMPVTAVAIIGGGHLLDFPGPKWSLQTAMLTVFADLFIWAIVIDVIGERVMVNPRAKRRK
ncbi:MAG: hypothetical protein HKL87_03665 [Acidimicrobiaceae bacterium]|nr:hypothetical protein [Acidimicrobiaceae bacterium]